MEQLVEILIARLVILVLALLDARENLLLLDFEVPLHLHYSL